MKLTKAQGQKIAEEYIAEKIRQSEFLSRYEFSPILGMQSENDSFWTFMRGSEELGDLGIVPGAVYACVDKRTGRVWTMDEVESYYTAEAAARQTPPNSIAA
jgi:hypothetical protein